MFHHFKEFVLWMLGRRPLFTEYELRHYAAQAEYPSGWLSPLALEIEREEHQHLNFVTKNKRQKLLPSWKLFPGEQRVQHNKARTIAQKFRDRWRGRK